jgi:hypothetical protein
MLFFLFSDSFEYYFINLHALCENHTFALEDIYIHKLICNEFIL